MTNYSEIQNPKSAFQRGFTLIEIIVVIVILSIVSAITIKFLVDSLRIYTMTVNQKTLYDEAKLALGKDVQRYPGCRKYYSTRCWSFRHSDHLCKRRCNSPGCCKRKYHLSAKCR